MKNLEAGHSAVPNSSPHVKGFVPARMEDLSEFSQPDIPLAILAQALAPPSTQAQVSCPPSCVPEHVMYKNRLQEYTQKTMVHSPIYNTINEGSQHAPRYRSTVFVDGKSFTCPNTFPQKKEAEQNVAQIALDLLSQMMKDEGCPLIHEDAVFCKSILNEYAAKMNMEMPNYTTIQPQGAVPVFISSLVFNGVTCTGGLGTSKKEAERLAARAAIQSLYDDSKSKMVLLNTIKSKRELYAAYWGTKHSYPVGANVGGNSEASNTEHREALASGPANYILSCAIPEACSEVPAPHHLPQLPSAVAGASSAVGNSLISFVPATTEQQPIAAMSSGRKRRKNKKKANKKPRVDPQLPNAVMPFDQAPPCSVAK
ncbi:double-stranded RNA-binding protein 4-like [Rhodamnia argentea]|uniref:Double-stranded RNA-binding protein 4-like n=1 Tax=Rhodamnia argentea TaxID=178133 RepID=A0ABM3HGE6_9MYRT|nr:double-stranded RNA-binding protein 4-like [Rhodamnia argentea]